MAATRDKYQPAKVSERWFRPYTSCSFISWTTAWFVSTLGEFITWPSGQPYGKPALKTLIRKGWDAVDPDREREGYGTWAFNTYMKGMDAPIRREDVRFVRPREDIVDALEKNHAITIAGNTRGCRPRSPIRKWVGEADHRICVKGYRVKDGQKQTRLYEPMTPDSDAAHWGKWIPMQDVFDFGKRFKHWGQFLAERFIAGHFTREAKARRRGAKAVLQVQSRLADVTEELIEANRTIANQQATIVDLKEQLANEPDRSAILLAAEEIRQAATNIIEDADAITAEITVSPLRDTG